MSQLNNIVVCVMKSRLILQNKQCSFHLIVSNIEIVGLECGLCHVT